MTEKRFENRLDKSNTKFNTLHPVWDNEKETGLNVFEMITEMNKLNNDCDNLINDNTEYVHEINQMHKENEQLKQEKQHVISYLKKHYNYAKEQRQNNLDNPVLAKAYDIIRYDIRQLALDLGVDLND